MTDLVELSEQSENNGTSERSDPRESASRTLQFEIIQRES
jgi:hypothetical protein